MDPLRQLRVQCLRVGRRLKSGSSPPVAALVTPSDSRNDCRPVIDNRADGCSWGLVVPPDVETSVSTNSELYLPVRVGHPWAVDAHVAEPRLGSEAVSRLVL